MPFGNVPILTLGSTGSTVVRGGGAPTPVALQVCAPARIGAANESDSARGRRRFVIDEAARWSGSARPGLKYENGLPAGQQNVIRSDRRTVSPFRILTPPTRFLLKI